MSDPVYPQWATQTEVAKRYHLIGVHGIAESTAYNDAVSKGWLDYQHKYDHQNSVEQLVNREHKHNHDDF